MASVDTGGVKQGEGDEISASADDILDALNRVLRSPEFEGTERVQSFLDYVVRESLAGRGGRIRGKTILSDVYDRSTEEGRDPLAVVRVDAGRLRRYLSAYYSGSGKSDDVRIKVEPGSYQPTFSKVRTHDATAPKRVWWRSKPTTIAALCVICASLLVLLTFDEPAGEAASPSEQVVRDSAGPDSAAADSAFRQALFSVSPARLEAVKLASEARSSLLATFNPVWQTQIFDMFQLVIDLDANYFGGFAGAAEAEAIIALTMPPGHARDQRLANAENAAKRAIDLGPGEGWSHAAMAFVAFARRDFEKAAAGSARAIALSPDDPSILTFDALFALYSGDFERAGSSAAKVSTVEGPNDDFPDQSILASVMFHTDDYSAARDLVMNATSIGDPISPISLGLMIAIHQRSGDLSMATEMVDLMHTAWPEFPLDRLLLSLYRDPEDARKLLSAVLDAGWMPRK